MDLLVSVLLNSSLLLFYIVFSEVADSITKSQSFSDNNRTTLVSKDGGFVLEFFMLGHMCFTC